ncbi:hypothetical protein VTL71DRAFT_9333 [Oculimacula yallundae]|uniref:Clr5 domain-containing protein n=1 Tax=Oculimacula yallundae TaxID=86028 RepID=A0ABR4BTJ7_9HELO
MPKNWSDHEAELRRLYMEEGRTLKDVQKIMSSNFGFDASSVMCFDDSGGIFTDSEHGIRTYRTRFGEMGWKKNKSTNSRRDQKQKARSQQPESAAGTPRTVELSPPLDGKNEDTPWSISDIGLITQEHIKAHPNITIPNGSMEVEEILSSLNDVPPKVGLFMLLSNLKSGGAYLAASKKYILENYHRFNEPLSTDIFQLFEVYLNVEEQYSLAKVCIEEDLNPRRLQHTNPAYGNGNKTAIQKALESSSWVEAERILRSPPPHWTNYPDLLLTCSLAVVGERFLEMYKVQIDDLKSHWTHTLDVSSSRGAAARLRRLYIEVLKSFEDSKIDVDISYYKYAVAIADLEQTLSGKEESNSPDMLSSTSDVTSVGIWEPQPLSVPADTGKSRVFDEPASANEVFVASSWKEIRNVGHSPQDAIVDESKQPNTSSKQSLRSVVTSLPQQCFGQIQVEQNQTASSSHCTAPALQHNSLEDKAEGKYSRGSPVCTSPRSGQGMASKQSIRLDRYKHFWGLHRSKTLKSPSTTLP